MAKWKKMTMRPSRRFNEGETAGWGNKVRNSNLRRPADLIDQEDPSWKMEEKEEEPDMFIPHKRFHCAGLLSDPVGF